MDKEYENIPVHCQICGFFLIDDEFIKEHKSKFACSFDDEINPIFSEFCDQLKIGEWQLVEFLKRLSGGNFE